MVDFADHYADDVLAGAGAGEGDKHGRLYGWSERASTACSGGYRRSLTWVLDHPALLLAVFLFTLG